MLPKDLQQYLAHEFRFAANGVQTSDDFATKVYFFSVFYGQTQRIFNIHWEPYLALLHQVVQKSCQEMNAKPLLPEGVTPLLKGIPTGWMEALDKVSDELALVFEEDEVDEIRLYTALKRVAELTYILSGNGFYLFMKGAISLGVPTASPPPSSRSPSAAPASVSQPAPSRPSARRGDRGRQQRGSS